LLRSKPQPLGSLQLSTVQAILSSQTTAAPPHTPLLHLSPLVQALPSVHGVSSALFGFEQTPVAGSQLPAAWHWSLAMHVTGLAPLHTPATHESVFVHALPSLQAVPSALAGFEQAPVLASQLPAVWHWSLAAQTSGFAPTHTPFWHESLWVQPLPSEHAEPSALAGFEQLPVALSQVPAPWH
jgi:hypothetical protein